MLEAVSASPARLSARQDLKVLLCFSCWWQIYALTWRGRRATMFALHNFLFLFSLFLLMSIKTFYVARALSPRLRFSFCSINNKKKLRKGENSFSSHFTAVNIHISGHKIFVVEVLAWSSKELCVGLALKAFADGKIELNSREKRWQKLVLWVAELSGNYRQSAISLCLLFWYTFWEFLLRELNFVFQLCSTNE